MDYNIEYTASFIYNHEGDDLHTDLNRSLNEPGLTAASAIAPLFAAEFIMTFERDFDVRQINDILGLSATGQRRKGCTRLNPITGKRNPGYWMYRIDTDQSFECEPFFRKLSSFLRRYETAIRNVCTLYPPCELLLQVFVEVNQEGEYPGLRFPPAFLLQLGQLGITLDLVTENNYETEYDRRQFEELTRTFSRPDPPSDSGNV